MQDKASVLEFIAAGGKGEHSILSGRGNIGGKTAFSHQFIKPLLIRCCRKIEIPRRGRGVGDIAGEKVHRMGSLRGDQKGGRMFVIEGLLFVKKQVCEHGAVFHVVAVNDTVEVKEGTVVGGVQKEAAGAVIAFVELVVQIIVIVPALYHGVVDAGAPNDQPCGDIRVDLGKGVEVHCKSVLWFELD